MVLAPNGCSHRARVATRPGAVTSSCPHRTGGRRGSPRAAARLLAALWQGLARGLPLCRALSPPGEGLLGGEQDQPPFPDPEVSPTVMGGQMPWWMKREEEKQSPTHPLPRGPSFATPLPPQSLQGPYRVRSPWCRQHQPAQAEDKLPHPHGHVGPVTAWQEPGKDWPPSAAPALKMLTPGPSLLCQHQAPGGTCTSQTRAGRVLSWGTSLVPGQEEQGVTLRLPWVTGNRKSTKREKNYKF